MRRFVKADDVLRFLADLSAATERLVETQTDRQKAQAQAAAASAGAGAGAAASGGASGSGEDKVETGLEDLGKSIESLKALAREIFEG